MTVQLADLPGTDLGSHTASYGDTDSILYALAVGASATDLNLVYERDMRTLPTYACALGLWAVEAAGRLGAYDPKRSLHASQRLEVHKQMPKAGDIPMTGRIANVYDKGKASIAEVEVTSPYFSAFYSIFLPGLGGWGGDRGPSSKPTGEPVEMTEKSAYQTDVDQAALYRLTGDRHPLHIDTEVATANGFERPILHGLCTLGISARIVAEQMGSNPADLTSLSARLAAPVLPGDALTVASGQRDGEVHFEAQSGETTVIGQGRATFA